MKHTQSSLLSSPPHSSAVATHILLQVERYFANYYIILYRVLYVLCSKENIYVNHYLRIRIYNKMKQGTLRKCFQRS